MNIIKSISVLLLLLCLAFAAKSQVTVQVLRKLYADKISVNGIKNLSIVAEKADINIVASNVINITFEVIVTTRHPEKKQVIADYKKMKFLQETSGQTLYLRSYLLLEKGEQKPKSNYEVSYKITVPQYMALKVKNSFGNVKILGIEGGISSTLKFCDSDFQNIKAMCDLTVNYGSLKMMDIFDDVTISSKHTIIDLQRIRGKLKLDSDYGKVNLKPDANLKDITLKSNKTEINVQLDERPRYGINVSSENTTLDLPEYLLPDNSVKTKTNFSYRKSEVKKINLYTLLGSLTIK